MRRCLLILFFALAAAAQDARPQYRFLFVIDTSISMADRKPAVVSAVRELTRTSFADQIELGDTLDIVTFDSRRENRGFPTQHWNPARGLAIVARAVDFTQAEKFHRRSRLSPVTSELESFIAEAEGALVIILTDGEEPVQGLSADAEINAEIVKVRREAARLKRPVIISLTALEGELTGWRVYAGPNRPPLPQLPERPAPEPPAVAAAPQEPEPPKEPEFQREQPPVLDLPPGARILAAPAPAPVETAEAPLVSAKVATQTAATQPETPQAAALLKIAASDIPALPEFPEIPDAPSPEPQPIELPREAPAAVAAVTETATQTATKAADSIAAPATDPAPPQPGAPQGEPVSKPLIQAAVSIDFSQTAGPPSERPEPTTPAAPLPKPAPAPAPPPAGLRALDPVYWLAAAGSLCLAAGFGLTRRRTKPGLKGSLISKSLSG